LVDYASVDGHDEHRPTRGKVKLWLESNGDARLVYPLVHNGLSDTFKYLQSLSWQLDDLTGKWSLKPFKRIKAPRYLPTTKLDSYKPIYWRDGIIDHDDVLYFAFRILDEHPNLRGFLSAKFPYLLIDEFQDTNPVQTQVVKWLGVAGSTVGVIGDPEQSIYRFQGARYTDFVNLSGLPDLVDYEIQGNRRSTARIIRVLNHTRSDRMEQTGLRQHEGDAVRAVVGPIKSAVVLARSTLPAGSRLVVLARRNADVGALLNDSATAPEDPWKELIEIDYERYVFFEHLVAAGQLARLKRYGDAAKLVTRGISTRGSQIRAPLRYSGVPEELDLRAVAAAILGIFFDRYDQFRAGSVLDVYETISEELSGIIAGLSLTGVSKGKKFHLFASSTKYQTLAGAVPVGDDVRDTRTIHQAKGSEFDNVLVSIANQEVLDHLLKPTIRRSESAQEEKRITYVAMSRARDRLFLSIPTLTQEQESELSSLGIRILRVGVADPEASASLERVIDHKLCQVRLLVAEAGYADDREERQGDEGVPSCEVLD